MNKIGTRRSAIISKREVVVKRLQRMQLQGPNLVEMQDARLPKKARPMEATNSQMKTKIIMALRVDSSITRDFLDALKFLLPVTNIQLFQIFFSLESFEGTRPQRVRA